MTEQHHNDKAAPKSRDPGAASPSKETGPAAPPELRALLVAVAQLAADVAAMRAEMSRIGAAAGNAAAASEATAAYMRVLLPERLFALSAEEVRLLHTRAPDVRLKLTADFVTNMVTLRRGEVLEAGDARLGLYADRMQLALVVGGDDTTERVEQLVRQSNEREVMSLIEARRLAQQRVADDLARRAAEAASAAAQLAQESA